MINAITCQGCQGDHCQRRAGQVRKLPSGSDSNMLLCQPCFDHEISYRRKRNRELEEFAKYSLPKWEELEIVK